MSTPLGDYGEITGLLHQLQGRSRSERKEILDELLPLLYRDLKALARSHRYRWHAGEGPGTTSLVHEAYTRLVRQAPEAVETRRQFFCLASKAMRSILIDNARFHQRQKRGGAQPHLPIEEAHMVSAERSSEILALHDALGALEEREPDLARVVECRVFGGLTIEETGFALEISPATTKRHWKLALAILYREMQAQPT